MRAPLPPGITDYHALTGGLHPGRLGVAVVDALSWGAADDGLTERWNALPEWPQMLLRALMFRLAVYAAPTIHRRLPPGPHRGPSAASALNLLSPAETHSDLAHATRLSSLRTPSARTPNCRVVVVLCWAPEALITRCQGRSEESVRIIQPTIRGFDSPARAAMSP